jgi:hypothetical protein
MEKLFWIFLTRKNYSTCLKKKLTDFLLRKKLIILLCGFFTFYAPQVNAQEKILRIFGEVTDSASGEYLASVIIGVKGDHNQITTSAYGRYSLKLKEGRYSFVLQHVSCTPKEFVITISNDTNINFQLTQNIKQLQDITLTSKNQRGLIHSIQMSKNEISIEAIKNIPSVAGEPDLLKSIQLLPGVNNANEGSSNLNVRGGSFDQNLILLDEAPVFNPSHALGFFSTFNADALRSVSFYKGAFPAQYGGRVSSVIDIYMKEGNKKKETFEGGVGLIASRLTYEVPIKKNKSSFLLSGRYSYTGKTVNTIGIIGQEVFHFYNLRNFVNKNDIYFYDFNAKINFQLSGKTQLLISSYTGSDKFYSYQIDEGNRLRWGNLTSSIRLNHRFSKTLFNNSSLIFSNYNYSYFSLVDVKNFEWTANIQLLGFKTNFDLYSGKKNRIAFGLSSFLNFFKPGTIVQRDSATIIKSFSLDKKRSIESSIYLTDEFSLGKRSQISLGLRFNNFLNMGPGKVYGYSRDFLAVTDSVTYKSGAIINQYNNLEPRISYRYLIDDKNSLKMSYSKTSQFLHLISNSSVGLPTDIWIPADKYIRPTKAHQIAVGYFHQFRNNLEMSLEGYYKKLSDITDYRDNANLFLNKQLETQILMGSGQSYGIELLIEKKKDKLTGWLSYTWSNTSLKIAGVNNNRKFPARYDIRNNLSITTNYDFSKRVSFAGTFKFTTGGHITIPTNDFSYFGATFSTYSDRNGYTLPTYHRLDLAVTLKSKKYENQKCKKVWVFSLFNIYNRKNIYALFIKPDELLIDRVKAFNFYLYGIVPSITLNFKL